MAETAKLRLIVDADTKSAEDATRRLASGMDKVGDEAKVAAKATDKLEKETDQLGKEAKQTTKELDKQKKATGGLTSSMKGAVIGFAAGVVSVQAFKSILLESVQASFEHERAMRATAFALENTGEVANISVKHMDAWAESLQQATGVSSDFILRSTNLAITMGASAERAQQMTTASLDFAAATGRDASQAVNQLVKTLGGYAGELAEILPQVKQLTASQLKAGEAADVMAELVGGAALDMRQTAAGEYQVMMSDLEDLKQNIGNFVVELVPKSPDGPSIFQLMAQDLQDFMRGVEEAGDNPILAALLSRVDPSAAPLYVLEGRRARQGEDAQAGAEAIRAAQLDRPGVPSPQPAPFAPGPFLDTSDPGARFTNLLDELKLLQAREEDAIAIFRELTRAYSPEKAFELANSTQTLTEAQKLVADALMARKAAEENAVSVLSEIEMRVLETDQRAATEEAEGNLLWQFDREQFAGPGITDAEQSQIEEATAANAKKNKDELDGIGKARAARVAQLANEFNQIQSLSSTVASVFINGIRDAQNLGDVLNDVFNSVLDALAARAAAMFAAEAASSLISLIPGAGPIAAVAPVLDFFGDDRTTMAPTSEGAPTDKQLTRSMARLLLPEQRRADARGL